MDLDATGNVASAIGFDSRFLPPVSERGQGAAWGFAADTDRNDPNANQSKVRANYAKEKSRMIAIRLSSTVRITESPEKIHHPVAALSATSVHPFVIRRLGLILNVSM